MTNLLAILAADGAESSDGGSILSFLLLPGMVAAMYFLIIRPNSKRRKQAAALQSVLSVGDEVITTSGIVGTITGEDGDSRFWLEIDDDVQVRISRGAVAGRLDPDTLSDSTRDEGDAADDADGDAESDLLLGDLRSDKSADDDG
jgi:preprotein translocase subunit YajC